MSEPLRFTAPIEIQASADSGGKVPTVSVMAYGGGIMTVGGWGPVAIDLRGLRLPNQIPLVADHNTTLAGIVGHGRPEVADGRLLVQGTLPPVTDAAKQVVELVKGGFQFQASVGVEPTRHERIDGGATVTVNGRRIKAEGMGFLLIRAGTLKEVSIVAAGADSSTAVHVAAQQKGLIKMEEYIVTDETKTTLEANFRSGNPDPDLEARRLKLIDCWDHKLDDSAPEALQARAASLRAKAVGGEISLDEYRLGMLQVIRDERPRAPAVRGSNSDRTNSLEATAAGVMIRAGFSKAAERQFDERTLDGADRLARVNLIDLAANSLRVEGKAPESFGGREAMIRAALSTVALPSALGLAGEKILIDAYVNAPRAWDQWCKVVSVSSFRDHTIFRPTFAGGFEALAPGGEIKHANVTEETATIAADTFAKILGIDRTQLVNDDAGAFGQAAESMGKAAARKLNDLVISTLLAGAESFFTAGRGNLITTALSVEAVAAAVAVIRSAVDSDGANLDIVPKVLVVGPALESDAVAICRSEFIQAAEGAPMGNSLRDVLTPVVDPRMGNTTLGGSSTAWAVLAGPADSPQAVCFLNGQQNPTIEVLGLQADVNRLAYHWRGYHDFGTALVDWRAGVLSTGVGG